MRAAVLGPRLRPAGPNQRTNGSFSGTSVFAVGGIRLAHEALEPHKVGFVCIMGRLPWYRVVHWCGAALLVYRSAYPSVVA